MSYGLTYTPQAERELKQIWKTAANPVVVTTAIGRLESTLTQDPFGTSSDFGEGISCILVWPLAALFTVDEATMDVYITHVYQLDTDDLN